MPIAVLSVVLGVLGLASAVVFPTLSVLLGILALVLGYISYRRSVSGAGSGVRDATPAWERRLAVLGMVMGAGAVTASILVVVVTTGGENSG